MRKYLVDINYVENGTTYTHSDMVDAPTIEDAYIAASSIAYDLDKQVRFDYVASINVEPVKEVAIERIG